MRVALVFDKQRPDTTGIYFERALKALGHDVTHFWVKDTHGLNGGFELYFRVDDGHYTDDLPDYLRPRVYWVSDTHYEKPYQGLCRLSRTYDLALVALKNGARRMQADGVHAVWARGGACDAELHRKQDLPKTFDVGFVGNDGGIPRKFYLQELRERYPNSSIGRAPYTKLSEIYSQSKIGFAYTQVCDTLTMRSFEILGAGAMLLLNDEPDAPQDLQGFEPNRHVVLYHSPTELFEKMDYYLTHDTEREAIAAAGHELALREHTYTHRMQFMLDTVADRLGQRYPDLARSLAKRAK